MAGISWSEKYSCDIRSIDDDHKMLFEVIDYLGDQIRKASDEAVIATTIDSLILYVKEHFDREERFMLSANFPDFIAHKAQHTMFSDSIHALKALYQDSPELIAPQKVFDFLVEWLSQHIQQMDREYIPYVKGEMHGDPEAIKEDVFVSIAVQCSAKKAKALKDIAEQFKPNAEESKRLLNYIEKIIAERKAQSKAMAIELFGSPDV